jgi:hypothetical protein
LQCGRNKVTKLKKTNKKTEVLKNESGQIKKEGNKEKINGRKSKENLKT